MAKICKYGCNTSIEWNDDDKKFYEVESKKWHSKDRCTAMKTLNEGK